MEGIETGGIAGFIGERAAGFIGEHAMDRPTRGPAPTSELLLQVGTIRQEVADRVQRLLDRLIELEGRLAPVLAVEPTENVAPQPGSTPMPRHTPVCAALGELYDTVERFDGLDAKLADITRRIVA